MAGVWRLPTTPNSGVWSTTRVVTKSSPFDSESLFLFYIPGLARLSSGPSVFDLWVSGGPSCLGVAGGRAF